MRFQICCDANRSLALAFACLAVFAAGCASKGNMGHVKVETTSFAAQNGLTVKDWSWSDGKFSVQLASSPEFTKGWMLFVQLFDAKGGMVGQEIRFLNFNQPPSTTSWSEVQDVKLTDQTARVVFDIQSSMTSRREPHY